MTHEVPNYGVQITGGKIVGPVAGGFQARAHQVVEGPVNNVDVEVERNIAQLHRVISEFRDQIVDSKFVEQDASEVEAQLRLPAAERDRDRILDSLQRISRRAAAAMPVIGAIEAIKALLQ